MCLLFIFLALKNLKKVKLLFTKEVDNMQSLINFFLCIYIIGAYIYIKAKFKSEVPCVV